jgi:ribonucleotide monophosphatase NagD (HAD superfamily)
MEMDGMNQEVYSLRNDKSRHRGLQYTSLSDTWMLDGVIWMGDQALGGIADTLSILRSRRRGSQACEGEKKIIFVSNNTTKSKKDYIEAYVV